MVNVEKNDGDKSIIFNHNDMDFDEDSPKYIYPDSPELNFADDEEEDSPILRNVLPIQEENEESDSIPEILVFGENLNNSVNNVERNPETEERSRIHRKKKRRHLRSESPESVKSKRLRQEGHSDASVDTADINIQENSIISESDSPTTDIPEDESIPPESDINGCFTNMFKSYNKLFSSTNHSRICPYKSLEEIDKNIPIKPKSALSLLFPLNAFFDRKITNTKTQLSWDSNKTPQNPESPFEDKMLFDNTETEDLTFEESTVPPKPLQISEELMPKTEYEITYWRNLMPRIGFNFIIQPGICRIENDKWLRLKEIDDLNGIECTEMDIEQCISDVTVDETTVPMTAKSTVKGMFKKYRRRRHR